MEYQFQIGWADAEEGKSDDITHYMSLLLLYSRIWVTQSP